MILIVKGVLRGVGLRFLKYPHDLLIFPIFHLVLTRPSRRRSRFLPRFDLLQDLGEGFFCYFGVVGYLCSEPVALRQAEKAT